MSICVPNVYFVIERGTERWLCMSICVQNVCVTEIHLSMSLTHTQRDVYKCLSVCQTCILCERGSESCLYMSTCAQNVYLYVIRVNINVCIHEYTYVYTLVSTYIWLVLELTHTQQNISYLPSLLRMQQHQQLTNLRPMVTYQASFECNSISNLPI